MGYKVVVVGAGPAGMMAAISAGQTGASVLLIDRNHALGRKLLLSGKGRCNLTNACSLEEFFLRFSRSGVFLRDAFKKFFNRELMEFFEKRGLQLKVERQQRVFPSTDSSVSIVSVLKDELHRLKVGFLAATRVDDLRIEKGRVTGVIAAGKFIPADSVILATGGVTYRFTGSSAASWKMVEGLGHSLVPARPGLIPLRVKETWVKDLEGLTLKNCRLRFVSGSKKIDMGVGEVLFRRRGISGPLVLTASGRVLDLLEQGAVSAAIDLKPALSAQQLDERLRRELDNSGRKIARNVLRELVPQRLIPVVLERCALAADLPASQLSREQRRALGELLKNFTLAVTGSEPLDEAMVTRGGVSLKEIDPRTMASRRIKGLYFAGELIDVDADTGGFNLQAAFSTGYLAGQSAATARILTL